MGVAHAGCVSLCVCSPGTLCMLACVFESMHRSAYVKVCIYSYTNTYKRMYIYICILYAHTHAHMIRSNS